MALAPAMQLAAARLAACQRMPYLSAAILALVPVEKLGLGTLGVTKSARLYYDPAALAQWTVQETAGVLIHEVWHLLRDHHTRCAMQAADPQQWNSAADAEINDDLVAANVNLPWLDKIHLPSRIAGGQPDNLTAEDYLTAIRQHVANGGTQTPSGPGAGHGNCGGCAGNPGAGDGDDDDPNNPAPKRSVNDLNSVRQRTAAAIADHAARHGSGSVPDGSQRWAKGVLKAPTVRWQDKLARTLRRGVAQKAGNVDRKHGRLSRRQWGIGLGPGKPIVPSLVAPIPEVAVVVDTSGSMGSDELRLGLGEIQGVLRAVGAGVRFIACDCDIHSDLKVRKLEDIIGELKGGGGTDFRPPMELLAHHTRRRPDLVVFVTDGDGPAPDTALGLNIVWLLVGSYKTRPQCSKGGVQYGEFIELGDD
jgi:predicted metal-dependent peptidase